MLKRVKMLATVTAAGLVASGLIGAVPAAADPAPLAPPTVTPSRVIAGGTTVVAGTGCVNSDGRPQAASAWLTDASSRPLGPARSVQTSSTGAWSVQLTVPLSAPPYLSLYVHADCGYSDLDNYRVYPEAEVVVQPNLATPWHAQQPQLPAVPNGGLSAVQCAPAGICVAVGSYRRAAVETPLAEVFDGASWTVSALPELPDSRGASLTAVSCAASAVCAAVGRVTTSRGVKPLAASYSRGRWQLTLLPVSSDNENVTEEELTGVSCPAVSLCVAVGRAGALGSGVPFWAPSAYVLRGTTWTASTLDPGYGLQLDSVSCRSTTSCVAVGTPEFGGTSAVQLFNGSTWSAGPLPADDQVDQVDRVELDSVSCPANGLCVAVGVVTDGRVDTVRQPWAGQLDINGWTTLPLGDVGTGSLYEVSCAGPTQCVALGRRGTNYKPGPTFSVRRAGNTWSDNDNDFAAGTLMTGVACTRTAGCSAVGTAGGLPVAVRGDGAIWSTTTVPAPVGLPDGSFDGVACATDSACTAVGRYLDTVGVQHPLINRWDGSGWTLQTVPDVPSGRLTGVSCPTVSACTAVGRVERADRPQRTLVMQWAAGTGWQPILTGAAVSGGALTAVSCGSVDTCLAVGSTSTGVPLSLVQRAGSWTRVATPPHGSLTRATMPAVSCVGIVCRTIVNGYMPDFTPMAIGVRWNGTRWAADAPRPGSITAVACAGAARCVEALPGGAVPAVVRLANATATVEELPDGGNGLTALSCRDFAHCVTVGSSYQGASITRSTGTAWTLDPIAASVPYVSALNNVACVAGGGRCVAVGGADGTDNGPPTILVDTPAA